MNDAEIELMHRLEDGHWWFTGKRLLLRSLLGTHAVRGRILDLGCGSGGVLREFSAAARCFGTDRSLVALRHCRQRSGAALACADLLAPPFRDGCFDTILALDVIEHLDDDVAFLRAAKTLLASDGVLVIAAPALALLWSRHDETFQHRRRYTARTLRAAAEAAGLRVERISYLHAMVFPVALIWRVASQRLGRVAPKTDFWPIPAWLNAIVAAGYRLEAWLLARVDLPFGVSVACVARRGA